MCVNLNTFPPYVTCNTHIQRNLPMTRRFIVISSSLPSSPSSPPSVIPEAKKTAYELYNQANKCRPKYVIESSKPHHEPRAMHIELMSAYIKCYPSYLRNGFVSIKYNWWNAIAPWERIGNSVDEYFYHIPIHLANIWNLPVYSLTWVLLAHRICAHCLELK